MALFGVIRLALWVGIWWLLIVFDVGVMLAGVLAAVIAMLISILFLDRLRSAAALRWKAADDRRRERKGEERDLDADAEDSYLDAEGEDAGGAHGAEATDAPGRATTGPGELPELSEPSNEAEIGVEEPRTRRD